MKKISFFPIFFSLLAVSLCSESPAAARAEMQPIVKRQVGVPPVTVLKAMIDSNQRAAKDLAGREFPTQSPPLITWLADSDAAIQPRQIMRDPEGKVYSVRNLGFLLESAQEAIDFGVLGLFSPLLLITGNTDNQAIRRLMTEQENPGLELRRTDELLKKALSGLPAGDDPDTAAFEDRLLANIEKNVDYQVELAIGRYRERIKAGRLLVAGGIIDLHNRYGRGAGQLIITNINGETKDFCLRQLAIMRQFDPETLRLAIGRDRTGTPAASCPCRE